MPHAVQSKLLRALETGSITRLGGSVDVEIDVRVVAATNRDLQEAVAAREFREDLYFRLAVFPVRIPALRERRSDIALLARHFAAASGVEIRGRALELTADALRRLEAYSWPGNVRELQNCIERACILTDGPEIGADDLDLRALATDDPLDGLDYTGPLSEVTARALRIVERRKIAETLAECDGNRTRAAEKLGISTKTMLAKVRELGL